MNLEELRRLYNDAVARMDERAKAVEAAEGDDDREKLEEATRAFDEALEDVKARKTDLDRAEARERARAEHQPVDIPRADIRVGREEPVYRQDGERGFFGDLTRAQVFGDSEARERLARHDLMAKDEMRDVTSGGGGAGVIPPVYLSNLFAPEERSGRPFVSSLPKMPLPDVGTSFTLPKTATAPTVAAQGSSENSSLSETDADINTVTVYVATLAGIQDYSIQTAERTDPAFDAIIARSLMGAYWETCEADALAGAGTAGEIMGLGSVGSIQTVTYTAGTPDQSELLPKTYDGIQKVYSNHLKSPDRIVMHPRRSSWLAAGTSTAAPLFQQGGLMQASGAQDMGQVGTFAGLPVIATPQITTDNGAGTNEDVIYVINGREMYWMESNLRAEVFRSPGSDSGFVRYRIYAYAAFVSARYPNAIAEISGTGLVAPTF